MAGTASPRPPATIQQQAEFLEYLMSRCTTRTGALAAESYLLLQPSDIEELQAMAGRLRRMAPLENEIKRLVTGQG